jgi:phosphoglycolate phosphatase-like HAD superfamily hydrolase
LATCSPKVCEPGTLVFDIDGVLANFTRGFTRIANKLFGTPVGDARVAAVLDV